MSILRINVFRGTSSLETRDVSLLKSTLLIFIFLNEKLISKLVIHHVSVLEGNT